jgi:hypothetical protein
MVRIPQAETLHFDISDWSVNFLVKNIEYYDYNHPESSWAKTDPQETLV